MIFPIDSLALEYRELGLLLAVLIGFGFGFVLERAGFGQSTKLAAQFYLHDMTVFKVMFSAIVTAMLGLVIAPGLGWTDLGALSRQIVSWTYLWPMLIGGLLLGAGFIISGYCPGTSVVAAASGNIDGIFAFIGVVLGSLIYSEIQPQIAAFHNSGELGALFLYEIIGLPAPVLAFLIVLMAVGCFIGAEKVERIFTSRLGATGPAQPPKRAGRRLAFAGLTMAALVGLGTLIVPVSATEAPLNDVEIVNVEVLAQRISDEPWSVRILDIRSQEDCSAGRVAGSECIPEEQIANLGIPYAPSDRDLVVITAEASDDIPTEIRGYRGKIFKLEEGFQGWKEFALTEPEPPASGPQSDEYKRFLLRSSLYQALTGVKQAPPPPVPVKVYIPKKKKGGSCS